MSKHLLHRSLLSSATLISLALPGAAVAAEYTIDTAVTTPNGGYTLADGDTLIIGEDGSITTTGSGITHAVNTDGTGPNTVINYGTINAGADDSSAIFNENEYVGSSQVINYGTINVTGGYRSIGIYTLKSPNSETLNYGDITVTEDGNDGIAVYDSTAAVVRNYGTIVMQRDDSVGIALYESDEATIENFGTIVMEDWGDWSSSGMMITYSDDATVVNAGAITAKGPNGAAISIWNSTGAEVTNSGFLVSEQGDALFIADSTDSTLNLSAPGYIGGSIHLGPDGTAVNFETGASHSVLWTLDGNITGGDPVISGDIPGFYNASTKQFATYDPSALAGALDEFGDMTRLLSDAGRDALARTGFWVSGLGGDIEHEGDGATTLDRDIRQYGVAAGYTGQTAGGATFNVMGGYLRSEQEIRSQWASSYDVESDGWFLGASAERRVGALTFQAGVTGGATSTGQQRFVNDNLAETDGRTLGESWADASYDSWFLAPEIGVSATIGDTDGWSMTPAVRLRYANQWADGFTETGSNADATVDERTLGMFEASAEVAVARAFSFGSVSTRVGYQTRKSTGDDAAAVTLVDATQDVGFGEVDADAAYAALGVALDLGPSAQLGVNVTGFFGEETLGGQATARLSASF